MILGGLGISWIKYSMSPKISKDTLVIGTLGQPEQQEDLKNYLENNLVSDNFGKFITGKKIQVIVDGGNNLPFQEAQNKMKSQAVGYCFRSISN